MASAPPGLGKSDPSLHYNAAIPLLIGKYLPEGMLGLAITGLLAAFMAGVAANVTAFNTVVTYDLWQSIRTQGPRPLPPTPSCSSSFRS